MQSEGHNFNTHIKYVVTKDDDNKIPLPVNCVQADASDDYRYQNLIIRDGYLYDMDNHTDVFTTTSIPTLNLVLVQQFEHLPEYARRYITVKAARRFASRFIGDKGLTQLVGMDETEALNQFKAADARSADLNILKGDANTFSIINRQPRRRY